MSAPVVEDANGTMGDERPCQQHSDATTPDCQRTPTKLHPLFHRTLRVNLPPSAFDYSLNATPVHSPSASPSPTARSGPTTAASSSSSSSKDASSDSATLTTAAQIVASTVEQSFQPALNQAVQLSPVQQKAPMEATSSLGTDSYQQSPVQQPCTDLKPATEPSSTALLPVIDLAAALVISDDPLLSTGACIPANATSPTTPTTPQTPTSFLDLSTTISAPIPSSLGTRAMTATGNTDTVSAVAWVMRPAGTGIESQHSIGSSGNTPSTAVNSQQYQAIEERRHTDTTRCDCSTEGSSASQSCPSQCTSATPREASNDGATEVSLDLLVHKSLAETSLSANEASDMLLTPRNGPADDSDDTNSCSIPISPPTDSSSRVLSSIEGSSSNAPFFNLSTAERALDGAASQTPTLIMHGNHAFNPDPTCPYNSSQSTDSASLPIVAPTPPLATLLSAPHRPTRCVRSKSTNSLPLLGLFPEPPQSTHSESAVFQRYHHNPDFPVEPATPRPRFQRHIWRPPILPTSCVFPCNALTDSSTPTFGEASRAVSHDSSQSQDAAATTAGSTGTISHSHSNTWPPIHRAVSLGSCASSSYATSCATVTPYAWLPCDHQNTTTTRRLSNATSASTRADVSGSLPVHRQSRGGGSITLGVPLDTLTLTPTPPPFISSTGLPESCAGNDPNREPQSKVPVAAPVTPTKVVGSFFHLPDPVSSNTHVAHATIPDISVLANWHMPDSFAAAANCTKIDSQAHPQNEQPFLSPFRHAPSWSTAPTMNIPRYPLSSIATVPVADHPCATTWGFESSSNEGSCTAISPDTAVLSEATNGLLFLEVSSNAVDCDTSSHHPSEAPSNISIGTPSSSSSHTHDDAGHACALSPRSDRSNDSPVARALEHMQVPLKYPGSEDSASGGFDSPPTTPDNVCIALTGSALMPVDSTAHNPTPSPLSAESPSLMSHGASAAGGSDNSDFFSAHDSALETADAQPCPSTCSSPSPLQATSRQSSGINQAPLRESVSDDIELSDAKLQRMSLWTQLRQLPIRETQTLCDSPSASPPRNMRRHSSSLALPRSIPEPFAHPLRHGQSYSLPHGCPRADSVDLPDCLSPLKVLVEPSGVRDSSVPLTRQSASASMQGQSQSLLLPDTSSWAANSSHKLVADASNSEVITPTHARSQSLLLAGGPSSDRTNMQPQPPCRPAQTLAATLRGTSFTSLHASSIRPVKVLAASLRNGSFSSVRSSSILAGKQSGDAAEGGLQSRWSHASTSGYCDLDSNIVVGCMSRSFTLASVQQPESGEVPTRSTSTSNWRSRVWGGGSVDTQSGDTMALRPDESRHCRWRSALPCVSPEIDPGPTTNRPVPNKRPSFVARRFSGCGLISLPPPQPATDGVSARRKLLFRPEAMRYLGTRASSFLCGAATPRQSFDHQL